VAAAATLGADLEWHRARELTRRRVADADLVLCMATEHRPLVAAYDRSAADRTFLLAAFVRALPPAGAVAATPGELLALVAKEVAEEPGDDVADPIGGSDEAYAACARRLDELVGAVVGALARVTS
jgi:protein-tyrosine phosphatase